jgi:hypothetical protein
VQGDLGGFTLMRTVHGCKIDEEGAAFGVASCGT